MYKTLKDSEIKDRGAILICSMNIGVFSFRSLFLSGAILVKLAHQAISKSVLKIFGKRHRSFIFPTSSGLLAL